MDREHALAHVTAIGWTLRPATAADRDFLVELNRVAMGAYLEAAVGWDDAALAAYLDERFDAAGGQVIQVGGIDVGELLVDEQPGELCLVRLALLPEWQGRGMGSAILRMLVDRANELESALVLRVLQSNRRATRLYEALGFVRTGETDADVTMRLESKL